MDVFALVDDVLELVLNLGGVLLKQLIRWQWLLLAFKQWVLPPLHLAIHVLHILFHLLDQTIAFFNSLVGIFDELVDAVRVPLEGYNTGFKGFSHRVDLLGQQGLLDWQQSSQDVVVHVNNDLKPDCLNAIGLNLGEQLLGGRWNWEVDQLQVLDLSQDSAQLVCEVQANKAFNCNFCGLAVEQELLKVFFRLLFNTLLPSLYRLNFKCFDCCLNGLTKLLDIFELLAVLHALSKDRQSLKRFLDSVAESGCPAECTTDRWHVASNWCVAGSDGDEFFAFLEDLAGLLQVILAQLKQHNLFAFQLVLDAWSV